MADKVKVELGEIQKTLFIMVAARARQTGLRRPVLTDQKAVEAAAVSRPPAEVRAQLPGRFRRLLPVASRLMGDLSAVTLFRTRPSMR